MSMRSSVERYYLAKRNAEESKLIMQEETENIIRLMESKGRQSFKIEIDNNSISALKLGFTKVITKRIAWNIKKLKQKMKKEMFDEIVDKTYIISDMQGLVEYLKQCNVNPKTFRSFLNVQETVNEKKLDNLSEIGKIKQEDIEGCYEVRLGKPYLRMTENK